MKRKWDLDNQERQRRCIDEVIARIEDIDDISTVGVIAAQDIIDIVAEHLAPEAYNKGVRDAKKMIADKINDIEADIAALELS